MSKADAVGPSPPWAKLFWLAYRRLSLSIGVPHGAVLLSWSRPTAVLGLYLEAAKAYGDGNL